jgi:Zn-dependent oligopeptidase
VVTLKYPDLLPIVQLAKRPETRKKINDVNARKLNEENTPLLERTLKLRRGMIDEIFP